LDPLTQGTLASALAQSAADPRQIRGFALAGAVGGIVPDLDILIRSDTDPILYLEFHRQFSHSLVFIPIGAALCALLLHPVLKRWLGFRATFIACLLGYATHGLLDACTSYGTQLFWPFSDTRVAWNWISVIDPLLSLPLFGLVLLGIVRRRRVFAITGFCWALAYLAIGAVQHQRATTIAEALAAERDHEPVRLVIKPGFANLLLWKSLYEADGRYYVDGIRAGVSGSICEGDSISALVTQRDLAWLDPASRQALDLERFDWYSDGWLALDPEDPFYAVDVRYASLPNRIAPLWGLKVDPRASLDAHASWHVVRSRRGADLDRLIELIAGRGCRTLRQVPGLKPGTGPRRPA